ncbi:MAG TPA: FG-GAP-like repeat-containing protein, partial [Bryobacterales bacterium]|nr:FG-GAP-like repeat-containing protein [Bryobacterales bacterium]
MGPQLMRNLRSTRLIKLTGRRVSSLLLCGYFCGLRLWAQQPPAQNYVLGLSQYQIAAAPLVSALNLSDPFTMEGWLFLEVASPNAVVMGKAHSPSGSNPNMSWALILDGTGRRIQFQESTGQAGSLRTVTNTTGLPLFQWVHVAATLSSGTMQLFVNGQLVGSAMSAGAPENAAVPFALGNGANPDGSVANTVTGGIGGALSQVSLWNRALSATELQSNLGKYLQGTEPGLAAYWPLDDGPGQTVRDLGPNHVNLYFGSSGQPNTFQPSWFPTAILNNGPYFSFTTGQISTPPAYVDAARLNQGGNPGFLLNLRAMPPSPFRFLGSDGKGNFSEATAAVLGSVQTEPLSPYYEIGAVADFNGDGRQDVLIANPGPDALPFPGGQSLLLMQTAAGTLSDETASRLPLQNVYATAVGAADVDGDGSVDVYLSSFGSPTSGPEFLLNDGTGHFTADASRLPPSIAQTHYQTVGFSDVNQDGSPDLILGGAGGPAASDGLFLNDGTGVFSNAANPLPPRLVGSRVTLEVSSADFDGDGWPDLLMPVSGGTHDPSIGGLQLLLNNGDGTFRDASDRIPLMWAPGTQIGRAIPIDFNHDGWMDIVTFGAAGQVPAAHHLFLNTGQGHFIDASAVLLPLTQNVTVYPGDFNGDGLIDLMYFGLLGQYTAALNLKSVNPVASAYAPVPGGPNLPLGSVLHGASFTQRGIAPGEIISIFGSRMGPTSGLSATANASGQLLTSLAGTSVLFDGVAAPLIYVKDDQINAIIPYSVAGKKTTMLQVQSGGIRSNALPLPVVPAAPGIFTVAGGKGQAVAL